MCEFDDVRRDSDPAVYADMIEKRNQEQHPMKRLIICCDGTWQSSNHGLHNTPSNITKISRSIAKYETRPDGSVVHQVVWYDAGVGTDTETDTGRIGMFAKKRKGAFGIGLEENVCEGYNFLVNNYNIGDEIYLFGFSRGAYTARALAGLVCSVGLCTNDMMDDFWEMYTAYKKKKAHEPIAKTPWGDNGKVKFLVGCIKHIKVKVVGVFDTVGSLGYPTNTHADLSGYNVEHGFHNTDLHPQIENAFHALAIDEHRASFGPTLWSLPKPAEGDAAITANVIQCWFPGVHINIGGGSDEKEGDLESMSNITFAWMVDRVRESTDLVFDNQALHDIARKYARNVHHLAGDDYDPVAYAGWGIGRMVDSYEQMKAAGSIPRAPGQYPEKGETREFIHPVVAYARDEAFRKAHAKSALEYKSPALEGFERVKNPEKPRSPGESLHGIYWRKFVTLADRNTSQEQGGIASYAWSALSYLYTSPKQDTAKGEKVVILIPEFVIPPPSTRFKSQERWLASVDLSPHVGDERLADTRKRTEEFLQKLDRGD